MASLDQTFQINLVLSFLVGSVWVTAVTVIAERFGSKIGGFIGGLPSTIVIALLFIGLTQSADDAAQAAIMIPMVMGVNGLFIMIYLAVVRRGLIKALGTALFFWFIVNSGIVLLGLDSFWLSVVCWITLLGASYYITEYLMVISSRGGIRVPYTLKQMLGRGMVSGFIIALAVLVSRLAGPVIGGIFSTFPVIFMSTLYITYRTGGPEFSRAVAKTLMLSGMINVGTYAIVAHFAYSQTGLFWGTIISMVVSGFSATITYRFIRQLTQ